MGRRHTQFKDSLRGNMSAYYDYFDRLTELAISMFKWENLPDSIDERFLELTLFMNGFAVFFKDEVIGYLSLACAANGQFDVYRIPTKRRAYASNGYQKNLTNEDSVLIYNNMLHTNQIPLIRRYAKMLYELDRIIMTNAKAQKTPILLQGTEQQRLTLKNLYMQYEGNEPFIFGDTNLDINALKAINTEAPYVADKLYQLKTQIWNEVLTVLGISNLNIQKKERLITDEAIRSNGGTIASRYSRLESRRYAAEQINKMFGLNIDVNFREDFRQTDDEYMVETESEDGKLSPMVLDLRTNSPIKEVGGR